MYVCARTPVSYTHLDVYKRQLQNIPRTAIVIFSDEAHFHLAGTVNKQNYRYWAEAVSYTHLDVYKRQVKGKG